MNFGEQIHGLNVLCGVNFSNDKFKIAMKVVHSEGLRKAAK